MVKVQRVKSEKVPASEAREANLSRAGMTAPYFDLSASISVAEIIYNKGGGTSSSDQLAAWLGYKSTNSGTYLTRVSAANKHFGLITSDGGEGFAVTDRGRSILSPVTASEAASAKVDAFLAVPLFAKVFEQFRGGQLPPEVGLKNLLRNTYKIVPDRVPQTVRVFLNSAEQAGFFSATGDHSRLVKPTGPSTIINTPPPISPGDDSSPPTAAEKRQGGNGGNGPTGVHFAIMGLLNELPAPGTPWSAQKKQRFIEAFKATIEFIYPTEDGGA